MSSIMSRALEEYIKPMFFRPKRLQVAALCHRDGKNGKEVLLITSRGTGRWILPKGWPINGLNAHEAALQEAWEEAGVASAAVRKEPVGTYEYMKKLDGGAEEAVETLVYAAEVTKLAEDYPECSERTRKWMTPAEAADLVHEPQLQALLRAF